MTVNYVHMILKFVKRISLPLLAVMMFSLSVLSAESASSEAGDETFSFLVSGGRASDLAGICPRAGELLPADQGILVHNDDDYAPALTLAPADEQLGTTSAVVVPFAIPDLDAQRLSAVAWIGAHYSDQPQLLDGPSMNMSSLEAERDAYQLAVWQAADTSGAFDLEKVSCPTRQPIIELAKQILREESKADPGLPPNYVVSASLNLALQKQHAHSATYQVTLSSSHSGINDELVILRREKAVFRTVQTRDGVATTGIDYKYASSGTLQASWSHPVGGGTLLRTAGNQYLMLAGGLQVQRLSPLSKISPPGPHTVVKLALINGVNSLGNWLGTFVIIALGLAILLGVSNLSIGLVKAVFFTGNSKKPLIRGAILFFAGAAGLLLIVMLTIIDVADSDVAWQQAPPKVPGTQLIKLRDAAATSEWFNGRTPDKYSPYCVLPGHAKRSGRPWMSARQGGLPQVLRINFASPAIVTGLRIVPGWANGDPADLQTHPGTSTVIVVADNGVSTSIGLPQRLANANLSDAEYQHQFKPIKPVATSGLYLITTDVESQAANYAGIATVDVQGSGLNGRKIDQTIDAATGYAYPNKTAAQDFTCP